MAKQLSAYAQLWEPLEQSYGYAMSAITMPSTIDRSAMTQLLSLTTQLSHNCITIDQPSNTKYLQFNMIAA